MQSSSVSSDFANQFLKLDSTPPTNSEVVSVMNVKVRHEEPSTQTPPLLNIPVTVIPETSSTAGSTIPPTKLSQLKQADYSAQLLKTIKSQIPAMMDAQLSSRLEDSIKKSFRSYTSEFEKKAKDERKRYIDLVEKSVKEIINDEVKNQLPEILPKEVSDYATPFELKKILLDKIQKSKSYRGAQEHKDHYDTLVKSYKLDKDLFESYGKVYSLKRGQEDKDKDEDPPAGLDQGLKKQKTSKDFAQVEEPMFETADTEMPLNQGEDLGNTDDQPNIEAASKDVCKIAKAGKAPPTFDELISTPIDFSTYVMNNLKIENLTQEHLVGPAFNLLKGTCKSRVELEYHFEECYKVVTDKLDWMNPEGHEYPFDLSKPLPLIKDQGCQVISANYFINNDLEYLKGGSSSRKYTNSTTKTKAVKYDTIQGIEDMVPSLWSLVKKWYDYGYLEEIIVRREDQQLYKFKEGDFPRLNLRDIKDLMLLLVQKKLSNLEKDVIFDLNVALRMSDITKITRYTAYNNPQGIIYQDKFQRNRLMSCDELYKLCDGTLSSVRKVLHDIASILEMDYLPKRRWSKLDRKRSRIMIKEIDQQLFERRLMRNLEKFVGGKEYREDFRLLEQTI
ncbi:hypothetical protein Tco_0290358 [Tanacetum coccineum]